METLHAACSVADKEILNGLKWTSALDEKWMENRKKYKSLLWQYFGSQTGIMRNFPGKFWIAESMKGHP